MHPFFGELAKIRNDFIQNTGTAKRTTANCKILNWFSEGDQMFLTTAMYVDVLRNWPWHEITQRPSTLRLRPAWCCIQYVHDLSRCVCLSWHTLGTAGLVGRRAVGRVSRSTNHRAGSNVGSPNLARIAAHTSAYRPGALRYTAWRLRAIRANGATSRVG